MEPLSCNVAVPSLGTLRRLLIRMSLFYIFSTLVIPITRIYISMWKCFAFNRPFRQAKSVLASGD